ncbi:hypothetical protein BC828DRAFT_354252 [Blastocladiella britannica]|nr:hypothetical protein BC828DRAFT_354252 [Blastocladiella britannica]
MPKAAAGVTVPMAAAAVTAPKEAAAAPVASTVPATQPAAPALLPTEPFTPPAMTLAAAPLLSPSAAAATNAATLFPVTPTQPNGNRSTLDEVAARSRPPSATPRRIDPRRLSVSLTPNKSPALQFGLRSSPVIGSTSSALGPPSSSTDLSQSVLRSPTSEKMEVLVSEYVGLRSGKDAAEMKVTTLQMHLKMTEEAHMQGMQQLVSEQLARAAVERRLDEAAAREQQLQQGLAALQARDRAEAESASVDRTALEELQRQVAELQRQIVDHMARETETRARADAASADFDHRQAQARVVLAVIAEQEATGLDRLQNIRAEIETAGNLAAAAQQRLDELQVREKEATRLVETALVHKEAEQHAVRHLEGQVRKLEEQCEAAQARLDSIPRPVAIEKVASPPPPPPPEPRPVTVSMASYYEPSVSAQSQGWLNESECEAIISRFSQEEMDHFRSRAALLTPSELGQCRSMLDFVAMCYSARIVAESGYVDALERVNRARIACPGDVERMHDPLPRVLGDGTMRAAQNVLHYD